MRMFSTHKNIIRLLTVWVILGLLLGTVAPAVAEASPERKHGQGRLYAGEPSPTVPNT